MQDLTGSADKRIPNELLERAESIAVIPQMIKGAFGIGGRYGKGVVAQRLDSGRWSAPAFIEIGGGSFGAQIGGSATDLVLIFTARKALERCRPVAGPSWRGTPEKAASGYTTPTPTTRAAYGAQFPSSCLDVHEHAYFMDYGADRKAYLKVFWKISTGAKPTICSNGLP